MTEMNRAQRRKRIQSPSKFRPAKISALNVITSGSGRDEGTDFSSVPTATVCESIWLLVSELRSRGYPVYDFDHKNKSVQGIKIIRNRVYFLAAEEADNGEEQERNKENGNQTHG